jgi:DnaA regulatory inactivator Hda
VSGHRQLPLDFEHRPSLTGENFLVAESNRDAVVWLDRWPDWPTPALVIYGPAGCGKTHLAHVFLARGGGRKLSILDLSADQPRDLIEDVPACVVEDAERFLEAGLESALLHLYNALKEAGGQILLTSRQPPSRWPVHLADLRSRLNTATAVRIGPPDDTLMQAVVVKLFADRQLKVGQEVVTFMLARMERSFEAARELVASIDEAALKVRRKITVRLVREVLKARETTEGTDEPS